jgi:hypothetical protein
VAGRVADPQVETGVGGNAEETGGEGITSADDHGECARWPDDR